MRNTQNFTFFLILLFNGVFCYAQRENSPLDTESLFSKQAVQTPITAAMMQNIVYPVNYSTGVLDIKIPLYEIQCGDLTLPIYLSYHPSGVKVNDLPGWVGQGWSLTAEPMITRSIKGKPDSSNNYTCDFKKKDNWSAAYRIWVAQGARDEQPDEYYYQIPDHKGMFMYVMEPVDASVKYMPLPYENIKIYRENDCFHILDDKGTSYRFDGGIERSNPNLYTVGWKASSMVSANKKDSLSFIYEQSKYNTYQVKVHNDYIAVIDQFDSYMGVMATERMMFDPEGHIMFAPDEWMQTPIVYNTASNKTWSYQLNDAGNLYRDLNTYYIAHSSSDILTWSQPLREIRFSGGKVVFTQDSKKARLSSITVYDQNNKRIKEIQLQYKDHVERYFLMDVQVCDEQLNVQEKYSFDYHEQYRTPSPGDRSIDYWGYANGVRRSDSATLVPYQSVGATRYIRDSYYIFTTNVEFTIGSPDLSRESDEYWMMCGTLRSITYPTGSTDEFIYEANKYEKVDRYDETNREVKTVGGLRIKQIRTTDQNQVQKVRSFTYGRNENGFGKMFRPVDLEDYMLEQTKYYGDPLLGSKPYWGQYIKARYRVFLSNPSPNVTYNNGSPIMYEYVTEYEGTPENNTGKTVYEYALEDWYESHGVHTTITGNHYRGWQYGHPVSKMIYQNKGGQYQLLESEEYTYDCDQKNYGTIVIGEAFYPYSIRECYDGGLPPETYNNLIPYNQVSVDVKTKLQKSVTRKVFVDGRTIQETTQYEYGHPLHIYPTKQTETISGDATRYITEMKYPHDYGTLPPYSNMIKKNIVSPVIRKDYINGARHIQVETPYINPYTNIYAPGSLTMRYDPESPVDTRVSYRYDSWGRMCEETKDNLESVVYLWGYNHRHIIARIDNTTYDEVAAEMGGRSYLEKIASDNRPYVSDWEKINRLRTTLPHAQVTTYVYQPLVGVTTVIDPAGLETQYNYDAFGRLRTTYIVEDGNKELLEMYDYHYVNP